MGFLFVLSYTATIERLWCHSLQRSGTLVIICEVHLLMRSFIELKAQMNTDDTNYLFKLLIQANNKSGQLSKEPCPSAKPNP